MQFNIAPEPQARPTGAKARLAQLLSVIRFGYQYGFIPYVVYLGMIWWQVFIKIAIVLILLAFLRS